MTATPPRDRRAMVAVDLGAESCRVSLLRWRNGSAQISMAHRFPNAPVERDGELHWEIEKIFSQVEFGLRRCAEIATEGVRSIGIDGWAVDYVRLSPDGSALDDPFCYRDERTAASEIALHAKISAARMRELTGIQLMRFNTVYQMAADKPALRDMPWLNLPEYLLYRLGGKPVAEFTNATHTQMVGLDGCWSEEIFTALGESMSCAAAIVLPGTDVGQLRGSLAELPAFRETRLIAPCCHDTASAIAAVPDAGDDWAYISSGTWSLVGTVLAAPVNSIKARAANFTNLGGADGTICFHKNVNGMWLLRQCMEQWQREGTTYKLPALIAEASKCSRREYLLDVDEADLLLPGNMPQRISAQLTRRNMPKLSTAAVDAPQMAAFLFHSLAARYAEVLGQVSLITGKRFKRIYIFGGGSQNDMLNKLTEEATGLSVHRAGIESSTIGNLAVQLASLEGGKTGGWASMLYQQ